MTIEKLEHWYNEPNRSSSWPSGTDIINKINEIIDHLNSKEVFPDTGKKVECDGLPTPPVTSTIEEQINQIENIIRNWGLAAGADILTVKWEKWLKQLLSSLSPIQKKRTKKEIENRYDDILFRLKPSYQKKEVDSLMLWTVLLFLKDHNLLQE